MSSWMKYILYLCLTDCEETSFPLRKDNHVQTARFQWDLQLAGNAQRMVVVSTCIYQFLFQTKNTKNSGILQNIGGKSKSMKSRQFGIKNN